MVQADAHSAAEVLEADASPAVKRVYEDIRAALRVPLVNLVFRDLARYPDFLELAWRQLHPNMQTVYAERQADGIRARAVDGVAALGAAPSLDNAQARATLSVFHYVNPKLLIAVAALRAAVGGQYPKLEELPAGAKRQIPAGLPEGAPEIRMVDPAAEGPAREVLAEIREATGVQIVNSDYRALAQWPEYLTEAWGALRSLMATDGYRSITRELRLMAERSILGLPFRIEVNPHVMRLCGLDESEIDDIRATLDRYHRALPGLIANVSYLSAGAVGPERARQSPFPIVPGR
jgi:hypothetical protein